MPMPATSPDLYVARYAGCMLPPVLATACAVGYQYVAGSAGCGPASLAQPRQLTVAAHNRSHNPAFSLILHVVGGPLRGFPAKVALRDAQRQVDAARESATGGELRAFHETQASLHLDIRILGGQPIVGHVMRGRFLARQQAGARQDKRSRAYRHHYVGGL